MKRLTLSLILAGLFLASTGCSESTKTPANPAPTPGVAPDGRTPAPPPIPPPPKQ